MHSEGDAACVVQADSEAPTDLGQGCPDSEDVVGATAVDSDHVDLAVALRLQMAEGFREVAGRIIRQQGRATLPISRIHRIEVAEDAACLLYTRLSPQRTAIDSEEFSVIEQGIDQSRR